MITVYSKCHALKGDIQVPGDKSISHRAVILGSIAEGTTTVEGFLESEDCLATCHAMRALGVSIEGPVNQRLVIQGVGKYGLKKPDNPLDCGNSGTTMRLLAGLLAAMPFSTELIGDASLMKRPMERVRYPLVAMGAELSTTSGTPPLFIRGGALRAITYAMPEASAQVKSCILLAGLYAKGETTIIEKDVTRDHTERMLKTFSYPIYPSENVIKISSHHVCQGTTIQVPGDLSSAAFFIVAATLIPGSDVWIRNVGMNPTRTGFLHILKEMGASIDVVNQRQYGEEPVADLHVYHAPLKGIEIPSSLVSNSIDEFPILFIAAASAKGQTVLRGAKELRYKECDRLLVMVQGLLLLGIEAEAFEDGIRIQGGRFRGGVVDCAHDHRVAMSFAIAGALASEPVSVKHSESIATSFPSFDSLAKRLGINIRALNHEA